MKYMTTQAHCIRKDSVLNINGVDKTVKYSSEYGTVNMGEYLISVVYTDDTRETFDTGDMVRIGYPDYLFGPNGLKES